MDRRLVAMPTIEGGLQAAFLGMALPSRDAFLVACARPESPTQSNLAGCGSMAAARGAMTKYQWLFENQNEKCREISRSALVRQACRRVIAAMNIRKFPILRWAAPGTRRKYA